ncbi:transient receptor potential cation channel subfamily V member 1-like [Lissotriton helveticus]
MSNARDSDSDSDSDSPSTPLKDKGRPLRLEVHDEDSFRSLQENRKGKDADKNGAPMDSNLQEEGKPKKLPIGINLNFLYDANPDLTPVKPSKVYTREMIYKAVVDGDPGELDGLLEYLQKTMKKLSDTEFKDSVTGKTCLLKAMLNLKNGKNDTIPLLLDIAETTGDLEELVNASYTHPDFKGQTALHIAIERRNMYLVDLLLRYKADIHAKAEGDFFKTKKQDSGFYFGELPLSLAACTNQPNMVQFLLDNPYRKADVEARDSEGNTVLHALVIVADDTEDNTQFVTKMYDRILLSTTRMYPTKRVKEPVNWNELTPLKLAAKLGKIEIFKHILRRQMPPECLYLSRKFTEWVYGPLHGSLYDLTDVDTHEKTSGKNSVVEIIAFGSDNPKRNRMIVLEPINKLLQEKWEKFGRPIFYIKFLLYIVYMLIFSVVAYNRPLTGKPPFAPERTAKGGLRFAGKILVIAGGLYLFILQIIYFWRRRPSLTMLLIDGYFEVLFTLQSSVLLCSGIMYLAGCEEYVAPLVFSLVFGWINLLYYTRGFQMTGIYSVMIQKTILRDIVRFLMVYVVFLFGFAAALVTLTGEPPAEANNVTTAEGSEDPEGRGTYSGLYIASLELFKFTIGMGDLEFNENLKFKHFFMFLLILYVVLTYVLLLNMLIALMSETVNKISSESESIWKLQRAMTILDIEKNLPQFLRDKMRSGIDITVGKTPDGKIDERRCFRCVEVNWSDWNENLYGLNEDPGKGTENELKISKEERPHKGNGLRGLSLRSKRTERSKQEEQMPLNVVVATPSDPSASTQEGDSGTA